MRQWKALMRKNFINWKRQPKCSFFEICCPAICMFLMVILRNVVEVEVLDFSALAKVKAPLTPAFTWDKDADDWTFSLAEDIALSANLDPFFQYGEYPGANYYANISQSGNYELADDFTGPAYFLPSDCLKINSFQLPRQEMPIIAVVGKDNVAT